MKELFIIFLIIMFTSAGCSTHDECEDEYRELEHKYTLLEDDYKSLKKSNKGLEERNQLLIENVEMKQSDIDILQEKIRQYENTQTYNTESEVESSNYDTSNEQQVYITNGGKRYHTISDCSGMKSPSLVAISKAISKGKTACNNCYSSSSNESSDSSSADDYGYSDEDYYYDEPEKCPLYDWCTELYNHGHEDEGLIYEPIEPPIDIETESQEENKENGG